MACFELACGDLGIELDHSEAVRYSGALKKVYDQTFLTLRRVLGCRWGSTSAHRARRNAVVS